MTRTTQEKAEAALRWDFQQLLAQGLDDRQRLRELYRRSLDPACPYYRFVANPDDPSTAVGLLAVDIERA